jgi:hypothetical protein
MGERSQIIRDVQGLLTQSNRQPRPLKWEMFSREQTQCTRAASEQSSGWRPGPARPNPGDLTPRPDSFSIFRLRHPMKRRKAIILIGVVALLAVGLEFAVWMNRETRGAVEVVNDGDATLKDLVIHFGETHIVVGDVKAGGTARVWLDGGRKGTVTLEFTQVRNPLTGFFLDGVDPGQLNEEQLKMVIHVRPNEVTREVADAEADPSPLSRLGQRIVDHIRAELSLR